MAIKKDSELMSISFEWEDIDGQHKDSYKIVYDIQSGQKVISFTNQSTNTVMTLPLSLLEETHEYLIEKNILNNKNIPSKALQSNIQNNIQKSTLIKKKDTANAIPVQTFSDYQEDIGENIVEEKVFAPKIKTNITKKEPNIIREATVSESSSVSRIPDPKTKANKPITIIGSKKESVTREDAEIKVSDNIANTISKGGGYSESNETENRKYNLDQLSKSEARRLIEQGYHVNKSGEVVKESIVDITLLRLLEQAGVDTD